MAPTDRQAAQLDNAVIMLPPVGAIMGGLITGVLSGLAVHVILSSIIGRRR